MEWMMGYPAGWVTDLVPRNAALKALGNAVVPQQAAAAWRRLFDNVEVPVVGAGPLLPTPSAANPNDGEDLDKWQARRERTKASAGNGNGFGTPLSIAVRLMENEL